MNAYAPPTRPETSEATAQHMRMLRRLAELGMELAELSAQEAKTAAQDPTPATHPEPEEPATTQPPRPKDPILAFARLGRIVQQAIKLHAALEQGAKIATTLVGHFADPRRGFLQKAFLDIADKNPDLPLAMGDAYNAIETRLAKDPEEFATLRTLLNAVAADLGLPKTLQLSECTEGLIACLSGERDHDSPDPTDWYIPKRE